MWQAVLTSHNMNSGYQQFLLVRILFMICEIAITTSKKIIIDINN